MGEDKEKCDKCRGQGAVNSKLNFRGGAGDTSIPMPSIKVCDKCNGTGLKS